MKNMSKFNLRLSAISIGVIALFSVSSVMADDEEIKALTQPKSSVQVEAISVDQNSAKFGEYNGLYGNKSGVYPNGALEVRGGSAYTNNEQGETIRWSVTGQDLGLTSRSANAAISDQGSWNFGVNFDQLQHNISNSYQTPYQGTMGGNTFTLPVSLTSPGSGHTPVVTNTNQSMLSDLANMNISSTRYNTTLSGTSIVDKNLNFTFEYNNLTQTGAKLQSVVGTQMPTGNNNSGNKSAISVLPVPTNYQTDTLTLAANWKNEDAHLTASYFGSYFKNNNNGFQWQVLDIATYGGGSANPMQTLSLAPSNAFNQLNVNGGYDFSTKTKLASNLSIGQNTQNQGFSGSYDSGMMNNPAPSASMNGIVNTSHADLKLTDQSLRDLTLTALAKYDERNNLSQSNVYQSFNPSTGVGVTPNTPLSLKQTQLLLGGDYRIDKTQKLSLTASNVGITRWCNQYGATGPNTYVSNATSTPTTTADYNSYFLNSSSCVSATSSSENKIDALYKIKASDDVNLKFGAGYANRKTQWDANAFIAMPKLGFVNSGNYAGFQPFFEASRRQYLTKASADWQASENLSFTLGGKYTSDTYPDSMYGVQNGNAWSLNFDGTYAYNETGSLSLYATQQNMQRNYVDGTAGTLGNLSVSYPTSSTSYMNNLQTNTTTLGLGVKQDGLLNGNLSLKADATYSIANSVYTTTGNACSVSTNATCGALPGIVNNLAIIKLGGVYKLDQHSKFGLTYWYQHLYSNDYFYNPYSFGSNGVGGIVPTQQTSPSYSVNVIMANYTYTFD